MSEIISYIPGLTDTELKHKGMEYTLIKYYTEKYDEVNNNSESKNDLGTGIEKIKQELVKYYITKEQTETGLPLGINEQKFSEYMDKLTKEDREKMKEYIFTEHIKKYFPDEPTVYAVVQRKKENEVKIGEITLNKDTLNLVRTEVETMVINDHIYYIIQTPFFLNGTEDDHRICIPELERNNIHPLKLYKEVGQGLISPDPAYNVRISKDETHGIISLVPLTQMPLTQEKKKKILGLFGGKSRRNNKKANSKKLNAKNKKSNNKTKLTRRR
jgi:hypothetical protein